MRKLLLAIFLLLAFPMTSNATPSATATFSFDKGVLQIVLSNTSTDDVLVPAQVLTAVFFDLEGNPALTPVSAVLDAGSSVFNGPVGSDGNVGGEFAFLSGLSGAPNGQYYGISSAGLGLFGNANFNGSNLQDPVALSGLNYGITSAGDILTTGNTEVTGGTKKHKVALIQNSVVFTLTAQTDLASVPAFSNVQFVYGTELPPPQVPVPEPATMLLLGSGLIGLAGFGRKKLFK